MVKWLHLWKFSRLRLPCSSPLKGLPAPSLRARMLLRCHVNHMTQKAFLIFKLGHDSNNIFPADTNTDLTNSRDTTAWELSEAAMPAPDHQWRHTLCKLLKFKQHWSSVSAFQQGEGAFQMNFYVFFQNVAYSPATGFLQHWLLPCKKHSKGTIFI